MAITVIKDYSLPFAKNDDYIYLDSDKKEEQQFRYGLHFLYNQLSCVNSTTNTVSDGYITVNTYDDLSDFNSGDLIYVYLNLSQSSPVPIKLIKVEEVSLNNYKFYIDPDELIKNNYDFYIFMLNTSKSNFDIYKCITKKVAANNDGYGVFSINDLANNLLSENYLTLDFKYLPFEEYLYTVNYDYTTISSSTSFNKFLVEDIDSIPLKFFINPNDYIIVQDDTVDFYNGVQKVLTTSTIQGDRVYTTDKPALKGISNSGGVIYRADYAASTITDDSLLSDENKAFYSGLKFEDVAGLNDTELNNLVSDYVSGDKLLSYAPREQKTYINDIGELWVGKDEFLDLIVTYEVEDVDGVLHYYDYTDNDDLDVYKIPSNPASINSKIMDNNAARGLPVIQECDKSYKILISYADEFFKFNLLKDTKFERVRLLFTDLLGSVNGFNFALYNAKTVSTSKDTFTKDINDFSNLNTIKFNKDSRGKTDVSTNVKYKLRLNSDFLTQEESNYFEDLLISNNVKMQYKGDVIAVNIPSRSVVIKEKVNGLVRYALDVEYSINRTIW